MEMVYYPSTRREAKEQGYKFYFTGKPCKWGHISVRYSAGMCYECYKQWHKDNEEHQREIKRQYQENNEEYLRGARMWYYEENKDHIRETSRQRREANKEHISIVKRQWEERNKDHVRRQKLHYTSIRKADRIKATPSWADLDAIKEIYYNRPEGYVVDHIIPLQGKNVCGLHVEDNLQYLTHEENMSKSNKFDETVLQYLPEGVEP